MNNLEKYLFQQLSAREEKGILRRLKITNPALVDFTSNDYLGLAQSEELRSRIDARVEALQPKNGATGSRLLSGNSVLYEQLENDLKTIFDAESCLVFNSGYSANLGVLASIPSRNDTIIYDELCHASIRDGVRLSLATKYSFRHNDLNDLEKKIRQSKGNIVIAIESIYSMDGDYAPLQEIVNLSEKYGCSIILDEAHSTGVMGLNGSGLATSLNLQDKIAIRIYTFGKAMGAHGACIAGSKNLINYLVNFSRPFIYTTALPDHAIIGLQEAFKFLQIGQQLQTTLHHKIEVFKRSIKTSSSPTAIQTVITGSVEKTRQTSALLLESGFDVRPIFSPTVPEGTERLRICLHTFNTDEEISTLANQINKHA
ncbi:MAG TPA: pyridoxal phosphate-dependent aminotransferase family protein [Chryseosolibacter sp.]